MLARIAPAVSTLIASVALTASAAAGDVATFHFANYGQSYLAAIFAGDPRVGRTVLSARITLDVTVPEGLDATEFFTDIALPIEVPPTGTNFVLLSGGDLGWSGSGTFHYFFESTDYAGTIIATRFGAETPPFGPGVQILETSQIELILAPTTAACSIADVGSLGGGAQPDGQLTADDIVVYLGAFFEGNLAIADIATLGGGGGADGELTPDDLILFLGTFFTGCP
ncbi:MAG: GC-type dockerin domain-anchored protein [Phycisphaerales bacterium]